VIALERERSLEIQRETHQRSSNAPGFNFPSAAQTIMNPKGETMTDPDLTEPGLEDELSLEDLAEAEDGDASAERAGLTDEAATLADSELEDEANLEMEGREVSLDNVLPTADDGDGSAGYGKEE
jgi:SpoVK/Ycf46/Vps4 family AAA+-type ATPase